MGPRWNLVIFCVFMALAFLSLILERTTLGDSLPFPISLAAAVCGSISGYLAAAERLAARKNETGYRVIAGFAGLIVLGMMGAVLLSHSLAIRAAFIGVSSEPQMVELPVEKRERSRRSRSLGSPFSLKVRVPDGGRLVSVDVDEALYDKVGAKPEPEKHCLVLPVGTGRWGLRRVWVPNEFDTPVGIADYRRCGRSARF